MLDEYLRGALLLSDEQIRYQHDEAKILIQNANRLIFLGNGGSFQGHMCHDYLKVGGKKCIAPESPSLLTCLANDFGLDDMFLEWLRIQREPGDVLIAVSSSGNSNNIINAVKWFKYWDDNIITITGFDIDNRLSKLGKINVHLPTKSYGVHECYATIFLHSILDDIVNEKA
jgi:D-sedoheptulose 7-phosphate isomerase